MNKKPARASNEKHVLAWFSLALGLLIVASFAGVFLGVVVRDAVQIRQTTLERGRSLFQELILTRRWASGYGGVYVMKNDGIESNPWLEHPDIAAADGRTLTLRNPALMTREISEIASSESSFRFHITSLKPLNPGNAPDAFERQALEKFEQGATETWGEYGSEFRYMGKLATENSCLACHAKQGYKVGDIRGGISVSFPIDNTTRKIRNDAFVIILIALTVIILVLAAVSTLTHNLRKRLAEAHLELERAATHDALTGLCNRGFIMEQLRREVERSFRTGLPLSCAIFDADNFKSLNDQEGHPRGDTALKAIAETMRAAIRINDIAGRYGGEEFIIIFPGIPLEEAILACDRIRLSIAEATKAALGNGRVLTVSIGVASFEASSDHVKGPAIAEKVNEVLETLINQADAALYKAKKAGKDRVERL